MKKREKLFVIDTLKESINGVCTVHRTNARLAGKTSVRVRITFSQLAKLMRERIDGLNRDGLSPGFVSPSQVELRDIWLPMIRDQFDGLVDRHGIEFIVEVPPPRKMHAR